MRAPEAATCPQCGASLQCGAISGNDSCWCFDMPRVAALPSTVSTEQAGCLCRACLQLLIDRQTDSHEPKDLSASSD